jgi:hypothetical protein
MISQSILPSVSTFAVDPVTHDLYIDSTGSMAIVTDQQAVLQACQQAALTLLGEMVLNTDLGIPYLTAVWVGVPNMGLFEGALRSAWLAIPGVTAISRLVTSVGNVVIPNTTVTTNAVSYSATIDTIFGAGDIASEDIFNG